MGTYWLPIITLIVFVAQWARLRKARSTLETVAPADAEMESPLAGARRAFERAISEKAVAPILRERLNKATTDRYDEPLRFGDEGLPELRIAEYEVPTDARDQLEALTKRMRGSIGIAGPRGAGKTTLIETFCAPRTTNDRRLTTVLAAPVRYDARDFILTLFGQLCTVVLSGTDTAARPKPANPVMRLRWLLAAGSFAIGAALVAASGQPEDNSWKEAALLAGGVATLAIGVCVALSLDLKRWVVGVTLSLLSALAIWVALDLTLDLHWLVLLAVGAQDSRPARY